MKKITKNKKKKGDEMNCKKGISRLLLGIIVAGVILVAGVVYVLASSSDDVTAPITSIELSGDRQSEPYSDWYKDQATVTLSAVDGEDSSGGGGSDISQISLASGSPDFSLAYQEPSATSEIFSDDFEDGLWEDSWSNSNRSPDLIDGSLHLNGNNTGIETSPAFFASQSFYIQTEMSTNQVTTSKFDIGIHEGFGPGQSLKLEWANSVSDSSVLRLIKNIDNANRETSESEILQSVSYPNLENGRVYTIKLTYNINTNKVEAFIDDMSTPLLSAFTSPINYDFRVMFGIRDGSDDSSNLTIDNIDTDLAIYSPAGYLMSGAGMSLEGIDYMDDVSPLFGSPEPIPGMLWFGSQQPVILPGIINDYDIDMEIVFDGSDLDIELDGIPNDIYAYLVDLAGFKITVFDSKKPNVFAMLVVRMFNEDAGVPASAPAFAKIASYNTALAKYEYTGLPVTSEGMIVYENGEAKVMPPSGGGTGPVVSGVDKIYYRVGNSGNFNVYTAPFVVNSQGVNEIYYYATDKAGNSEPVKSVIAKVDTDEDGDGVYGNFDRCPFQSGSSVYDGCPFAIDIDSEIHVNYIGGSPKFNKRLPVKVGPFNDPLNQSITSVEGKVYKLSDLGSPYGHVQQNCGNFYDFQSATPINVKSLSNGDELIGVPSADQYVVMQKIGVYEPKLGKTSILITCRNVEIRDFSKNVSKKVMPLMKSVKGNVITLSGAQTTVMTGSMLEVIYPENVLWEEGTESYVYTYIFTSDSDWTVDICNYVPKGYVVAGVYNENGVLVSTSDCAQAFVANQTKVVAFEVKDIGSPKVFDVDLKIIGKRTSEKKEQKANLKVGTKITPKEKMAKSGRVVFETKLGDVKPGNLLEQIKEVGERNKTAAKEAKGSGIGKKISDAIRRVLR